MTTNNKTHEELTEAKNNEQETKHSGKGNFGNPEQHSKAGKAGSEARKDETGHYKISEETHKKLSEAGKKGSEARKDETGHYNISEETHKKLSEAGKKGGTHSHTHNEKSQNEEPSTNKQG
jgi:hypothetical protein